MRANRLAFTAALAILAGCGRAPAPKPSPPSTAPSFQTYPLTGVVRKVDAGAGRVTIRHEEVPGFMPAMTMPFDVKDRSALEDLHEGDKVRAKLRVTGDESALVDLEVTDPAPPPGLTLDMSGGQPTLRARAKRLEPGDEVPDFTVTTQDGSTMKLSDLRGKAVALTFIYTRCPLPDFCPKMDARFAELARMVGAVPGRVEGVRLLSVSFDPEHDTPEVLARHAKLRGADGTLWRFAVASHDELRKVAEPLGLTYGPRQDEIIHNLSTAILGPDGRLRALYAGTSWTAEEAFKAIRATGPK